VEVPNEVRKSQSENASRLGTGLAPLAGEPAGTIEIRRVDKGMVRGTKHKARGARIAVGNGHLFRQKEIWGNLSR